MDAPNMACLLCISFVAFMGFATCNVAFKVQYNTNTTITAFEEVLKFDNVIFDTHGAYNPNTGVFTAPTKGVYILSVLLQPLGHSDGDFFIQRNLGSETTMTIRGHKDSRQMTTISQVDVGDTVHVGRGYGNYSLVRGGMDFTQFFGAMILKAVK